MYMYVNKEKEINPFVFNLFKHLGYG